MKKIILISVILIVVIISVLVLFAVASLTSERGNNIKFMPDDDATEVIFVTIDEERETKCERYMGVWNKEYKTCNESEMACMVLESKYENGLSYDISCKSGDATDCDVSIKEIKGCQFENSTPQQLKKNTGVVRDIIDQKKVTNTDVSGIHASLICTYVEMPCPENPIFRTHTHIGDKDVFVNVDYKDTHYLFKIINDTLYLSHDNYPRTYSNITELYKAAAIELNSIKNMGCKEFEKRNFANNDYITGENRKFAKEKLLECYNQKNIIHEPTK